MTDVAKPKDEAPVGPAVGDVIDLPKGIILSYSEKKEGTPAGKTLVTVGIPTKNTSVPTENYVAVEFELEYLLNLPSAGKALEDMKLVKKETPEEKTEREKQEKAVVLGKK